MISPRDARIRANGSGTYGGGATSDSGTPIAPGRLLRRPDDGNGWRGGRFSHHIRGVVMVMLLDAPFERGLHSLVRLLLLLALFAVSGRAGGCGRGGTLAGDDGGVVVSSSSVGAAAGACKQQITVRVDARARRRRVARRTESGRSTAGALRTAHRG